jgi:histidyl-tRNA synthetase
MRRCDAYVIGLGNVGDHVLQTVQDLRHNGFVAEANLVTRSLKAQFKSAERNQAKYILILGEDEVKNGTVNIKRSGEKEQSTVKADELIETLKKWEGR